MQKVLTLVLCLTLAACNLNYDPYAVLQQPAPSITPTTTDKPGTTAPAETAARSCTVTAPLHLRTGAGLSYAVIGYLQAGAIVTIQTQRGAWYQVTTASGAGFIHSQYCER